MIQKLSQKHAQQILDFCYKNERENLFVIGSFKNYKKPFSINNYYGYFKEDELIGLGVYFSQWENYVINAPQKKIIEALVDYGVKKRLNIDYIAAFKRYAKVMVERLDTVHKTKPIKITDETVLLLTKDHFKNFSDGTEFMATKNDIDDIVILNRELSSENPKKEITDIERKRTIPEWTTIIPSKDEILSKANLHGYSKNYFQIGGVVTKKSERNKGLAKKVVSKLCEHFFSKGISNGILFTDNDNLAAQKVYKSIGFKPVDEFIIAEYK